jgi:polysaccharide biosynthesis protein PslH
MNAKNFALNFAPEGVGGDSDDKREVPKGSLRVLYVLPYAPSPIRVRPFQLIRSLVRLGHRVTVVALDDGSYTAQSLAELREVCDAVYFITHQKAQAVLNCALALPTPKPLWVAYCQSSEMSATLRRIATPENFDVAHVEHLRAARYLRDLGALPCVLDAVDCITALQRQVLDQGSAKGLQRLLTWEEWSKLRAYEPRAYAPFDSVAVTSDHDAQSLYTLSRGALRAVVIPNGVDLDYFRPEEGAGADPACVVFSGKLSYVANADAAEFLLREILPRLRDKVPEARLVLAGSGPSDALRARAASAGNVTVTGFVEDLRPSIRQAGVAVCPLRIGVGIQNKALEAMALARPVVASPLATRALTRAVPDGGVRVAETAEQFAVALAEWIKKPAVAEEAGRRARNYVEENHRWETAALAFVGLYRAAVARTTTG